MSELLRIALRNVLRNRRRSALTAGAVIAGVVATLFLQGFSVGLVDVLTRLITDARLGAIQIHRAGFFKAQHEPLKHDLPDDAAFVARVRAVPGVLAVSARLAFDAMLSNGAQSTITQGIGIDPVHDVEVCPQRWTSSGTRPLDPAQVDGAVVSRALGEGLGAGPGSTLTLMATGKGGAANAMDVTLVDLGASTNPIETRRGTLVSLAYAQRLLGMEGRVTHYVVRVAHPQDAPLVTERLRAALGPEYDVSSWQELMPSLASGMKLFPAILGIVVVTLLLLVLTGIVNTMLMSVYERVREIGTMMAVGTRRRQVTLLFLLEAMVLGATGSLVGGSVGVALVAWLHARGMPLRPPGAAVAQTLRPELEASFVLATLGAAVLGAVLAAAYPAWRASRLTPVEALRSN